jgi:hypothetical protein
VEASAECRWGMVEENDEAQTKVTHSRSASHRGSFSASRPACGNQNTRDAHPPPRERAGGILVSPAGDWNSDRDHSNDKSSAREVL